MSSLLRCECLRRLRARDKRKLHGRLHSASRTRIHSARIRTCGSGLEVAYQNAALCVVPARVRAWRGFFFASFLPAKGEQGSQGQELLACLRVHYLNLRLQAKNFRGIHSVNAGGGVGARAKQELSNSDTNEKSLILHRIAAFSLCTRFQQHRGGEIPCSKV